MTFLKSLSLGTNFTICRSYMEQRIIEINLQFKPSNCLMKTSFLEDNLMF